VAYFWVVPVQHQLYTNTVPLRFNKTTHYTDSSPDPTVMSLVLTHSVVTETAMRCYMAFIDALADGLLDRRWRSGQGKASWRMDSWVLYREFHKVGLRHFKLASYVSVTPKFHLSRHVTSRHDTGWMVSSSEDSTSAETSVRVQYAQPQTEQ